MFLIINVIKQSSHANQSKYQSITVLSNYSEQHKYKQSVRTKCLLFDQQSRLMTELASITVMRDSEQRIFLILPSAVSQRQAEIMGHT